MSNRVKQWVRPEIRALSAYHVPETGEVIKLDAMENPYQLPDELATKLAAELQRAPINRYPDPAASELKDRLRGNMQVPAEMDILLGNGSDEIIQMIAMSVSQPGRKIMAPEPGFVMYSMIATFTSMDYLGVPLRDDFSLDIDAMLAAIELHQPAVIFLAYPNNPTGNLFDEKDVISIIEKAEGLVVLDEAYHPFAQTSFMSKLGQYDNLVVMRTVSKMGLAGLRLGLLAGSKAWLGEFDKVRLPYNINVLTQVGARFALEHSDVFAGQAAEIREQREQVYAQLENMPGIKVYPSAANFILVRVLDGDATVIFRQLLEAGILIKNLSGAGGQLANCLRITIGKPEENQRFLETFKKLI